MDLYKRSISKKNKIYRPYTIDGIGNFIFSPSTSFSGREYAYLVNRSGVLIVGYDGATYVDSSYGRIQSPYTKYDNFACYADPDGNVGGSNGSRYHVINSYGKNRRILSLAMYQVV